MSTNLGETVGYVKKCVGNNGYVIAEIKDYAGISAPQGFLICDGSAINRTTYSKLFSIIGVSFGAGNGTTTFNLPDFRGRIAVGIDSTQTEFNTLGKIGGEKTHQLTVNEMPSHNHPFEGVLTSTSQGASGSNVRVNTTSKNTSNTGGDQAHNNLQPYVAINKIIYTGV